MFTFPRRSRTTDDDRSRTRARLVALFPPVSPPSVGSTGAAWTGNRARRTVVDPAACAPGVSQEWRPSPGTAAAEPPAGPAAAATARDPLPDPLPDSPAGPPVGPPAESFPDPPPVAMGERVRALSGRLVSRAGGTRVDPGRHAAAVLVGLALVAAAVVAFLTWRARPSAEPLPPPPLPAAAKPSPTVTRSVVVAVAGRVRRPGIVTLPVGARVVDAIRAAGGLAPGADAGLINLARPLGDGEQVVVGLPSAPAGVGGPACPDCAGGAGGAGGAASRSTAASAGGAAGAPVVNVNTATVAELDILPGVGPVTAQRIVDWRLAHGRFDTVDQLREVEGIGPAKLSRLRDRVTV